MVAPKGNKFGRGYGRPPKEGFSDEECIALGEELFAWMEECDEDKKCDVVHLSEWYSEIKGITPSYWKDSLKHRPSFSSYYEKAHMWMGKRILKNKNLPPSYGNRFLPIYFKEVSDIEFEQRKREIDYIDDKKKNASYDENMLAQFQTLMEGFRINQSSARKSADTSMSADTKS